MNKLISMTYSWYKVSTKYNKNTYKWKKTRDKDWKTETIPEGMYDYEDLKVIQGQTGKVDPTKRILSTSSGCTSTPHLFVW